MRFTYKIAVASLSLLWLAPISLASTKEVRASSAEIKRLCQAYSTELAEPTRITKAREECERRLESDRSIEHRVDGIDKAFVQHKLEYMQRHRPSEHFLWEMDSPILGRARHSKKLLDFCGSLKNDFQYTWCTSLVADPTNDGEIIELCRLYTTVTRATQLEEPNLSQFKRCVYAAAHTRIILETFVPSQNCGNTDRSQRADCVEQLSLWKPALTMADFRKELETLRVRYLNVKETRKIKSALDQLSRAIDQVEIAIDGYPSSKLPPKK